MNIVRKTIRKVCCDMYKLVVCDALLFRCFVEIMLTQPLKMFQLQMQVKVQIPVHVQVQKRRIAFTAVK